ncbi:YkgJ family cysteine cluster protein [Desulfovibrio sp. OttesenSCG-928-A18]|nr:YkgJ family cysteine cluster protein [Desulfovibrio sp. OttesenSCG-928-A18]
MSGALPDLTPFFSRYESIAREADALFERVRSLHPEQVLCRERCSSCCHALFDLSLVEALYLNARFRERFPEGEERGRILEEADRADRAIARIKHRIYKESKAGRDSNELLAEAAALTVRCPLLSGEDLCLLYDVRPVTCRIYGVPTAIGGTAHTCGKTGFEPGKPYPTVALDKMQFRLSSLSVELAEAIGTAYKELASMYVPVSSALLTTYDASYLGVGGVAPEKDG